MSQKCFHSFSISRCYSTIRMSSFSGTGGKLWVLFIRPAKSEVVLWYGVVRRQSVREPICCVRDILSTNMSLRAFKFGVWVDMCI